MEEGLDGAGHRQAPHGFIREPPCDFAEKANMSRATRLRFVWWNELSKTACAQINLGLF